MMLFSQFITQYMCICLESILSRIFDSPLTEVVKNSEC